MNDNEWAEASSRLTSAVESALEGGMSAEEIRDIIDDAIPNDTPHVGVDYHYKPKLKKIKDR